MGIWCRIAAYASWYVSMWVYFERATDSLLNSILHRLFSRGMVCSHSRLCSRPARRPSTPGSTNSEWLLQTILLRQGPSTRKTNMKSEPPQTCRQKQQRTEPAHEPNHRSQSDDSSTFQGHCLHLARSLTHALTHSRHTTTHSRPCRA